MHTAMPALGTLALLALMAGVSASLEMDCSYYGLLNHLNITHNNYAFANVRPVKNWKTLTKVQVELLIFGILDVDSQAQTLTTKIWSTMGWDNEFLSWNTSDFCGIDVLFVPRDKLWTPDIVILEDVSDTGSGRTSLHTRLYPFGTMVVDKTQRLTTTCQMDLYRFPFDTQTCSITFGSMNDRDTLTLGIFSNASVLTETSENNMITQGEWSLISIEIFEHQTHKKLNHTTSLHYMVTIGRRPLLYVINLIVPLFYFLLLDVASFFINEARGEKLSFKVTIMLSISVLLLILKDILPSTANTLPLIALYCTVIFTLVLVSILEALLVSFLIDLDAHVAKKAKSSTGACEETQVEASHHKESVGEAEKGEERPEKEKLSLQFGDPALLKLILEEVKATRQEWFSRVEQEKNLIGFYERLARTIDSVFFVIYLIINVIFSIYLYRAWILKL